MSVARADVLAAAARLKGRAHRTPVFASRSLDAVAGCRLRLKAECLQRTGSFKFRGALNAVLSLPPGTKAVATHSSGNHAQALALAAREAGLDCHVAMPEGARAAKRAAALAYGARLRACGPTLGEREAALAELVRETGAAAVHPSEAPAVIAGQGTAALELLEDAPGLDAVLAPVGGGGLLSGTALALEGGPPAVGVEPELADDAYRSLKEGRRLPPLPPRTLADGLRTALGENTFALLSARRVEILRVSEAAIAEAVRLLWERTKLVVEPSGAVPLAGVLSHPERFRGRVVGLILSGGNVDFPGLRQTP